MAREIYKNAVIPATYTAATGTATSAYAGERRLGSADYVTETVYNIDGTVTAYPALDEVISNVPACKICGVPFRDYDEKKAAINGAHPDCLDEEG